MNIVVDVYDNLVANNILGGTDGWSFDRGIFFETDISAGIVATGENKAPINTSSLVRYPSFQILFASETYPVGYAKADEVYKYLLLTASIPEYIVISPASGILHLGVNDNDIHLFTINFDSLTIE